MSKMLSLFTLFTALALAGCHGSHGADAPGDGNDHAPFHEIGIDETIKLAGTEPFWGGTVAGERMTYTTPEDATGTQVEVSRFAGRGGLSFSGEMKGAAFTLAITPGTCSDGMSDRTYPFGATLRIGNEMRQGCAWTDRQPWKGRE